MSPIAEFARELHENMAAASAAVPAPVDCPSRCDRLTDIRAAVFDVYGTLINYWRPGLQNREDRPHFFKEACRAVADRFGFTRYLAEMDPDEEPEKTLYNLYCGLIALKHEKASHSQAFPEVKVEEIWGLILLMLKRRGYDPTALSLGEGDDLARRIAYSYNFFSLGRDLYPGVVDALAAIKKNNIALGLLSNAQFYTPIDLTLLIRDQSKGIYDDYSELFDPDLTFYSYEYGVSKPNQFLFQRLFDALYEYHITPAQTVFVGNDLILDIEPAMKAGMKTAFFNGDGNSAFFHNRKGSIVPDITFAAWDELPGKLSFHSEGAGSL